MWKEGFDTGGSNGSRIQDRRGPNLGGLLGVGLAVALAAFLASMLPAPLVAPAMSELLRLGAVGASFVAVLRQDRPFSHEVTAWDQAAILMLLGLLCGFFVDAEAVSQALNDMSAGAGTAPA